VARRIYLDYNATTPLAPAVQDALVRAASHLFGNPSSRHWAGSEAKAAVEQARREVAELLEVSPDQVIFTSGGTESNNHVLKSIVFQARSEKVHFVASTIEHPSIVETLRFLERLGAEVTWLPVDAYGLVDVDQLRKAIRRGTKLVTIMHANNEVGTIQPIEDVSQVCRQREVFFHTDAAQTVGKLTVRFAQLGCQFLTVAAHKFYGPKGVGALVTAPQCSLEPFLHGGGQEGGRRAGTENLLALVALGAAAQLARTCPVADQVQRLRDRLWQKLQARLGTDVQLNGHPIRRLPNTLHVSFLGVDARELLDAVPQIAASTGSACHEGQLVRSPVLQAMGLDVERQRGAVRFSVGRMTTEEEVDEAAELLTNAYLRLRVRQRSIVSTIPIESSPP
jgi:cysteine desulfurase